MAASVVVSLFCALLGAVRAAEAISITVTPDDGRVALKHPVRLDIQVKDVTNASMPWEDLLVHHAHRVHLYALHEVRFWGTLG
jgi:hypothetical protein